MALASDEKIKFREQIPTEQLPCFPKSLTPHGAECWIAGHGKTENESQSTALRSMTINAMDRNYCINPNHRSDYLFQLFILGLKAKFFSKLTAERDCFPSFL